ncbi:MAG: MFS transporter [Chloroflexi bacterium]|nr:MFS transporter [Chloroflexota bacterium]
MTPTSALPGDAAPRPELSTWQRIAYGLGDVFGGGAGVLLSVTYLFFLTSIVRIEPVLAGSILLISRVYDAITDPLEGVLADRTRTPLGRRRPYLLAGIPLIVIALTLLYYPVAFESQAGRFVFVLVAYLLFSTVSSIVLLNYNALHSELTLDYNERTSLSSIRIAFSTFSSLVVAVVPLWMVDQFQNPRTGYLVMGVTFGLIFALPYIATVTALRERPEFQGEPKPFNFRETFIEPLRIKTYAVLLIMYLSAFVAIDVVLAITQYYITYYMGRGGTATSAVLGVLLIFQAISVLLYFQLSKRTSKRVGYMVGAAIWIVTMTFSLALTPQQPAWFIYVFAAFVGLGTGGVVVMTYSMFPDIPDVDELQSGQRREGVFASLQTFMRKLAAGLALFMVGLAIDLAGFIEPIEQTVDGVTTLINQPQSDTFTFVIRLVFALVPIVFLTIGLLAASRYPLDQPTHARLKGVLDVRRDRREEDEAIQQEAAALKQLLVRREGA